MDELIERVSAAAGIEPEVARKALAIILGFLQKEGPAEEVGKVVDAFPGARDATATANAEQSGSGMLGGLFGGGGLMAVAGQLGGIGLGMGEMQTVGHELFAAARERVGEDTVGRIVGAIPGLQQFV